MPHLDLRWMREVHIKPFLLCVPFAYEKTVSKGLFIMHKSLLGCLYCDALFLRLTIHARVCIILWDTPVLNYSVTHLCHSAAFKKTHMLIHIWKDRVVHEDAPTAPQSVPLERRKSCSLAVGTCRMPLPFCWAFFVWRGTLPTPPVHLEAGCSVYINGPWAFSVMSTENTVSFHSHVHKTSTSTTPAPIHYSLLVMCVLNTAEIYMAAYANLTVLAQAAVVKQTTGE